MDWMLYWSPNPQQDGIWRYVFGRWLGFDDIMRVGFLHGMGALLRRDLGELGHAHLHPHPLPFSPCEDPGKRWPSAHQACASSLLLPFFQPLELWEDKFLLFKHSFCDTWLWQPKQTKTPHLIWTSSYLQGRCFHPCVVFEETRAQKGFK